MWGPGVHGALQPGQDSGAGWDRGGCLLRRFCMNNGTFFFSGKVKFPEIKEELFVSFLGYKGSDMIQLNRCKGVKDIVMENHLECGCLGSVRLKGERAHDNLLEDNNSDGSRRRFFDFFLGLT